MGRTKMQLHIRGNSNYVLEFATGNESLAELKAQVAEIEGSEDVLMYVGGKPVDCEMNVSSIGEAHIDVTVPLKVERFTVLWLVPVKSAVKLPKLKPKKRKRRKLDVLNEEFNITEDSLTLFKPSVVDVDPTLIHKNMCPEMYA